MIMIRPGRNGTPAHWRLISRTTAGTDVIATAPISPPGPAGEVWRLAVERLRDGDGKLQILPLADGDFEWTLTGPAGEIIARSPAAYRDAEHCHRAYTTARRAARTVLGAGLGSGLGSGPGAGLGSDLGAGLDGGLGAGSRSEGWPCAGRSG